jgi:hypothetical protein
VIIVSTKQSLQEQIIQKAWEDAEFKKQLLADPKTAVKDAFGVDVPDTIEVEVVEETANKFYLVLPVNPAEKQDEAQVYIPMWP